TWYCFFFQSVLSLLRCLCLWFYAAPDADGSERVGYVRRREAKRGDGCREGGTEASPRPRRDLDGHGSVPVRRRQVPRHAPRPRSAPEGGVAGVRSLASATDDPRP